MLARKLKYVTKPSHAREVKRGLIGLGLGSRNFRLNNGGSSPHRDAWTESPAPITHQARVCRCTLQQYVCPLRSLDTHAHPHPHPHPRLYTHTQQISTYPCLSPNMATNVKIRSHVHMQLPKSKSCRTPTHNMIKGLRQKLNHHHKFHDVHHKLIDVDGQHSRESFESPTQHYPFHAFLSGPFLRYHVLVSWLSNLSRQYH